MLTLAIDACCFKSMGAFTQDAKRRLATCASDRSITSLAQNMPTIHQQFFLSEVKQLLAKIATGCNILQVVNDVTFLLASGRFALRV